MGKKRGKILNKKTVCSGELKVCFVFSTICCCCLAMTQEYQQNMSENIKNNNDIQWQAVSTSMKPPPFC